MDRSTCADRLTSDFYDHPDLYDALLPVGAHLPFYADLARQQAGAVLELACGTGQLTIPIALDGHPTVGVDRSHAMLEAATKRASAANAPVAFVQADMRDFALGREFDLIVVAVTRSCTCCRQRTYWRRLPPSGVTWPRMACSHSTSSIRPCGCWPDLPASAFQQWKSAQRRSVRCLLRRRATTIPRPR